MSEELKPCPFCRRKANARRCTDDYGDPAGGYRCFCSGCTEGKRGETREEAIKLWNTRPIEDALQAELVRKGEEIKALEEIIEAEATMQELRQERALAQMCLKPSFDENNALRRWSEKLEAARARLAELREGGKS